MWRFRLVPDGTRIQFMKGRIAGLVVSAVLSTLSIVLFLYPGLNYGIDFKGGIVMEVRTPSAADLGKMRSTLEGLSLGPIGLQEFGSPQDVLIRLGRQVVAMLIYIWFRFEWQFGVGAVVTLVLDMTKIVGVYALTQFQFNLTGIVAILTIMGYSINDKVVVYDRVRENLRLYKGMPLRELIDLSINETLNRTIATSMTVFLATLPLALFAGEALRDFAIVLLLGIVVGTSSSIFIAAPILLFLGQKALRPGAPARVAASEPAE
ncbi:MAG: protein translocase subunit SecF [Proteobacteria bacterium]|nr:protein translocase subunit SecF [Pseudomonadota bacterium]